MQRVITEISISLPRLFLPEGLLERLTFVPELNDGLRVSVKGGDRCAHAAGERGPSHTEETRGGRGGYVVTEIQSV